MMFLMLLNLVEDEGSEKNNLRLSCFLLTEVNPASAFCTIRKFSFKTVSLESRSADEEEEEEEEGDDDEDEDGETVEGGADSE
jgi:hypothetical protein